MGVLICLKRRRKKMEERMRKVLHQDGTSWNVTKLIVGPGDKLRLSPFYPINAAQFAPREQNKDKLIKSKLTRLTNTGGLSVSFFCHSLLSLPSLQSNTVSVTSKAFFLCVCLHCVGFKLESGAPVNSASIVMKTAHKRWEEAGK